MISNNKIIPYSLKDAPALIEKLLPVQKLSVESYKEQMAVHGKTLTALGSYWKGRKPLVLNKACILGCLLPTMENLDKDLEMFEKLMAMDIESFVVRMGRMKPVSLLEKIRLNNIYDYFDVNPDGSLPLSSPFNIQDYRQENGKLPVVIWKDDIPEAIKRKIESQALPKCTYRELVEATNRAESCSDVHEHIWCEINAYYSTDAFSFPDFIEQLGIMRYGHRPRLSDTFCGSGQIPFEAARLGCDIYASDLNPVSCMLTWGALNIVGGSDENRQLLKIEQRQLVEMVMQEIDNLCVETDGTGWRAKVFLYCMEVKCPQTGWMVPLLPTQVVSKSYCVIAELVPDKMLKRYDIKIKINATTTELLQAKIGTVRSDGRGQDPYMIHEIDGTVYRTKISTLRRDYRSVDGINMNALRIWDTSDFKPHTDDLFQERLYAIQWMKKKDCGNAYNYDFRSVSDEDLKREQIVNNYVSDNLSEWQVKGWIPDMRIESGKETDRLHRERGWTCWHHLFNPRQLLVAGLINKHSNARLKFGLTQVLNNNCRLSRWHPGGGGGGLTVGVFDNQAMNPLFNYGCRGLLYAANFLTQDYKNFALDSDVNFTINCYPANQHNENCDIYITDPPYGDAVKYEEILEFFIAWLRKDPPREFSGWIWDSRRTLAIKGENEEFRRSMVASYKKMAENMPDNGIQIIMFTHQSGSIWADMTNIVWAANLQVTAAWYVATETNSAIRDGNHVKGTVLLVLRKRQGNLRTTRDDIAWDLQDEVSDQVKTLAGLNQRAKGLYRDENIFKDVDLQMAGYAAALRVLTRFSVIDGKDMATEAIRPRIKGEKTFVDEMIDFAVGVANQCLVPEGIHKDVWDTSSPVERFYLKMTEIESTGLKSLDNYQNFAKAFKVDDFRPYMARQKANASRLKSAVEFGRSEMSIGSDFADTVVRGILYAIMELCKDVDGKDVLTHLAENIPGYYNQTRWDTIIVISDFLAIKLEDLRPEEARAARILRELVKNQQM